MQFCKQYFIDEDRNGFHISSLMKRCWAAQLEILEIFDLVCKKLGIRYFLAYGSLLGAVRNGGFIPWDDDIDIWMLREDLNRFIHLAKEEIDKAELELVSPFTDSQYHNLAYRLINTRYTSLNEEFLMKYWLFPFTAGLDIFPLDYVPREKGLRETIMTLAVSANWLGVNWENEEISQNEKNELYSQLTTILQIEKVSEEQIVNDLWRCTDRICSLCKEDEADHVACMSYYSADPSKIFRKEWFDEIKMPFEKNKYPGPLEYAKVLEAEFGEDYMIPQRVAGDHVYPYYKRSWEDLQAWFQEKGIKCPEIYERL